MSKTKIGIIGLHQSGKSLLINCLLKRTISKVGTGTATTHAPVYYYYSEEEYAEYSSSQGCHIITPNEVMNYDCEDSVEWIHVYLNNTLLRNFTLVDLPGTGFNTKDNTTMREALLELDFAILLATDVKEYTEASSFYSNTLNLLKEHDLPYFFVFNCTKLERWSPNNKQNREIAKSDLDLLQHFEPLSLSDDGEYPLVNLMWYWCSIVDSSDELYKQYIGDIDLFYKAKGKIFELRQLEEASKFHLISNIFSTENRLFLELKRDFRKELIKIKKEICPIGTIQAFAFENIPLGWFPCDGRKLNIDEFPDLYRAIGITFGGNEKFFFNLPDLRGRFVRGWDDSGKIDKNRVFGSTQGDSIQEHRHKFHMESQKTKKDGFHDHYIGYETLYFGTNTWTSDDPCKSLKGCSDPHELSYGDSTRAIHEHELPKMEVKEVTNATKSTVNVSHETRPKNLALLFCIKAK